MADQTAFDLNRAIQTWRDNLANSPAFRRENLNELESHLRDSIAALQTRGLSAEEGFLIATRRLGQGREIIEKLARG
ncbi:MAG TPA: permease prefix domain 1-containing protein [Candidatus Angelobacter sp.]|nr:permease prefix domain 1-containing protein [Candidatus Angelobacter sp.]